MIYHTDIYTDKVFLMHRETKPLSVLAALIVLGSMIGVLLADQLLSGTLQDVAVVICIFTLGLGLLISRVSVRQLQNLRITKDHYLQTFRRYLGQDNRVN